MSVRIQRKWSTLTLLRSTATLGNSLADPQKATHSVTIWPNNSTLAMYSKKKKKPYMCMKTCTCMFTAVLFITVPKVEITQMAINWWADKQNVIYPFNGIIFSCKTTLKTETCYKLSILDEPPKHDANWKKPVTTGHILYDLIDMTSPQQANRDRADEWFVRWRKRGLGSDY